MFIVNSLQFGGAEKHLVSLLNGLHIPRFKLYVACLKKDDSLLPLIKKDRVQELFSCNVSHKVDFNSIRQLAARIEKLNIDIIVCINQYPMFYGVLAEKFAKISPNVLVIFHTTLIFTLKERLKLLLYRYFFKRCDGVVFVSKNQENYWLLKKHLTVSKAITIQNGIDINYFDFQLENEQRIQLQQQFNFSQDDYIVGICAALRYEKYHGDVIDAVKKLRVRGENVKLLIIGDGPERQRIVDYIALRHLEDDIIITGFQEDVRPYLALCDCMVIASHSETFSIAALEAMAMEKPMIMTDIGGASEQIEHGKNGFLYPKGDIETLAHYIQQLSADDLRMRMGREALRSVQENFSSEIMVEKYENLFETLVENHTGL